MCEAENYRSSNELAVPPQVFCQWTKFDSSHNPSGWSFCNRNGARGMQKVKANCEIFQYYSYTTKETFILRVSGRIMSILPFANRTIFSGCFEKSTKNERNCWPGSSRIGRSDHWLPVHICICRTTRARRPKKSCTTEWPEIGFIDWIGIVWQFIRSRLNWNGAITTELAVSCIVHVSGGLYGRMSSVGFVRALFI